MGRLGRQQVKCRQPAPPGHSGVRVRARVGADYTGRVRLDGAPAPGACQIQPACSRTPPIQPNVRGTPHGGRDACVQ